MKINIKNLYCKGTLLTLGPLAIMLAGCFTDTKPIQRPISVNQSTTETHTLDLVSYYRNEKYPMVIKSAQALLKTNPEHWEARFFLGLAYFNYGDKEAANTTFTSIPENVRQNMVDSCLELQGVNSTSNTKDLQDIAKQFFPDCLSDLIKFSAPTEKLMIDDKAILNYGRLYDSSISNEDDPEIRKLKEQKFLKTHKLTEDQLSEITARYLELLTEN